MTEEPKMSFGFNQIGEILAGRLSENGVIPLSVLHEEHAFITNGIFVPEKTENLKVVVCPECHCFVTRDGTKGICGKCGKFEVPSDIPALKFSQHGLERFIARKLAHDWTQPVSSVCRLGEVNGRQLFYGNNPPSNFYITHKQKTSVILGSNDATPPADWYGNAALLSEIFYLGKSGQKIHVATPVYNKLIPNVGGARKHPLHAQINHDRLCEWLQYLMVLLAPLLKKKVCRIERPSFAEIMDYFREHFDNMPKCQRTYRRDIYEMTGEGSTSNYDKRNELVAKIWKHLTDMQYWQNAKAVEEVTEEVVKTLVTYGKIKPESVDLGKSAWQGSKEKGTLERVAYVEDER